MGRGLLEVGPGGFGRVAGGKAVAEKIRKKNL